MKKWVLFLLLAVVLYLVVSGKPGGKSEQGRGILGRLDRLVYYLAWFLLLIYGSAFVYLMVKNLF